MELPFDNGGLDITIFIRKEIKTQKIVLSYYRKQQIKNLKKMHVLPNFFQIILQPQTERFAGGISNLSYKIKDFWKFVCAMYEASFDEARDKLNSLCDVVLLARPAALVSTRLDFFASGCLEFRLKGFGWADDDSL